MTKLIEFIFGVRKHGEPVKIVNSIKVREVNHSQFENWCREFNVGCLTDRRTPTFINFN
jgi:hypothetical protein